VFNDAERMWRDEFRAAHLSFSPARLVIFSRSVHSPCGFHEDSGPFYCPGDDGIYLDLSWLEALGRIHAVGPFAQAYIIGHEFGHHVQRLLTIDTGAAGQRFPSTKNALSVKGELQADCLAGVWAHTAYGRGPLREAALDDMLRKADAIGDDFAARNAGEVVDTGLFTHGSSAQRQLWLSTGFESGDPNMCDTFKGR
jgi:predicted metalloprotease